MTDQKQRPLYRVGCARIIGKDAHGKDELGSYREIGAVWPRKNGEGGAIMKLDIVPAEIANHQAVIFLNPPKERTEASE